MAGLIPKRTIDDIRFNTDIADLIGGYINLKKMGPTLKALCPFHKEKTPSFTVNHQKQFFHCFGCGAGGDAFSFVMKYEGVDYPTAIKILAERAGIAIEYEKGSKSSEDKAVLYKIHDEAAKFFRRCLLQMDNAKPAREYLVQREISEESSENFMIDLCRITGRHPDNHCFPQCSHYSQQHRGIYATTGGGYNYFNQCFCTSCSKRKAAFT